MRWLPPVSQVISPYVSGPTITDARVAKVHSAKNSARRDDGARSPTIARPADWLEPMHRPARTAATQNSPGPVAIAASTVITTQPASVSDSARRWPRRSCP